MDTLTRLLDSKNSMEDIQFCTFLDHFNINKFLHSLIKNKFSLSHTKVFSPKSSITGIIAPVYGILLDFIFLL